MVGQRLEEVVAQVPPQREAVGDDTHELALRTEVLEEHHQLELEEDDRVDGWPATFCVEWPHELPDEGEVEPSFQAAVEVVLWNQVLKREVVG